MLVAHHRRAGLVWPLVDNVLSAEIWMLRATDSHAHRYRAALPTVRALTLP